MEHQGTRGKPKRGKFFNYGSLDEPHREVIVPISICFCAFGALFYYFMAPLAPVIPHITVKIAPKALEHTVKFVNNDSK